MISKLLIVGGVVIILSGIIGIGGGIYYSFQAMQFIGIHNTIACTTQQVITLPNGANAMLIQATGQNIRIRFDGNPPTAASGFQIRSGDPPTLIVLPDTMRSFLAIQEASSGFLEWQGVAQ